MIEAVCAVVGMLLLMFLAYRAGWDDGKIAERSEQNFARMDKIMADIGMHKGTTP